MNTPNAANLIASNSPLAAKSKKLAFDLQAALGRCNGNPELLRQMVDFYNNQYDPTFSKIRAALREGDVSEVRKLAHRLKGTILYLAASFAEDAAEKVEMAGLHAGEGLSMEEAVHQLERECRALSKALNEYCAGHNGF